MAQVTKRLREEIDNPVIIVNTPNETATTFNAIIISCNTRQSEKAIFKLNFLNDKKARHVFHYAFKAHCQKEKNNSRRFKSLFGTINR